MFKSHSSLIRRKATCLQLFGIGPGLWSQTQSKQHRAVKCVWKLLRPKVAVLPNLLQHLKQRHAEEWGKCYLKHLQTVHCLYKRGGRRESNHRCTAIYIARDEVPVWIANHSLKCWVVSYLSMKWCVPSWINVEQFFFYMFLSCLVQNFIFWGKLPFVSIEFMFKTTIYVAASDAVAQPIHDNCTCVEQAMNQDHLFFSAVLIDWVCKSHPLNCT